MSADALRFLRHDRVLRKGDFDRAFEAGQRAFAKGLVVYLRDAGLGRARLGLVTSRKFGDAVRRNRARRLLREAFRLDHAKLPPLDIVALPQPGRFPDERDLVRRALHEAIARAQKATPRPRKREDAASGGPAAEAAP